MHTPNTVHKAVPTIFGRHFAPCFLALTLLAVTPLAAFANNPNAQNPPRTAMPDNDKRHLRGTVVDENGEPLMGVSVSALGSTPLAITDANGKFNVSAPANATQLTFSYVGMATQSINIGQRTNFLVTMTVGEQALKDVVVTGYQTISRERTTGSFNVVTPDKLKGKLQTSIMARLEGMVPGMMQQNGNLYIRGMATLSGGANAYSPLFVVDGLPFEGDINSINPATINELATGDWIRRGDPLCLIGDSGTGKSHLLIALGTAAAEQGYRVRYTLATRLVNELVEAADEKQLTKTINRYGRVDLLVIDELGYLELDRRGAELLFQVLTEREEKNAIAIASNQSFSAWTDTFTDPRLCAAIVDRLTYNATIIETGTNSYRLAHTRARASVMG